MQVNEVFHSIQGEGLNTGRPAIFVRLSGCNLSCSWCDTNHAEVKIDDQPEVIAEIATKISNETGIKFFVITGGEPTIQEVELRLFVRKLRLLVTGCWIALETNGTNSFPSIFDFVAVSPKRDLGSYTLSRFVVADEVKIVVSNKQDEEEKIRTLVDVVNVLWLQPEGDKLINVDKCYELAMKYPRARVGHQMHKIRGWL